MSVNAFTEMAPDIARPMNTARIDQNAPGDCQPLLLNVPRPSMLMLYHGKKPAINKTAPAMRMIFSPTARA